MDSGIIEDTAPVHWLLDQQETMEFLAKLYPDSRLLPSNAAFDAAPTMEDIISNMQSTQHWVKDRWAYFLDLTSSELLEERIAEFFNGVIQHVPHSHMCMRQWTGKAANNPVTGFSGAIRKPDLLLCEEGIISKRVSQKEKFDARTDIYSLGEVKQKYSEDHKKESYIELAGKVAFLLEAQDGRCAVPGIQLLGSSIILTLFDRGGSISTYPLDIHLFPEQFLRI
ncbi:hypothetical protein L210DRAFT_3640834 [Boletus edulis BED1]|uniref:Fungal-type protein kinase domain-containing protein n=1 Tax=Boletus edulis BED1 TaxID=1328754 RepID=A0AAD4C6P1_BOLED|nr:hypothetical protein L210DRAFT_3640834 [Boletus edulis BED1]